MLTADEMAKRVWNAAIEQAAKRLETVNDETSRKCIVDAIRALKR